MKRLFFWIVAILCGFAFSSSAKKEGGKNAKKTSTPKEIASRPFGPAAAREFIKTMTVADGFEVTLFASEPLLRNLSSMDIDARGRVWIADIANYGSTRKEWGVLDPQGDRILILEDTNADGEADKQTVFYQGRDIDSPYGVNGA